MLHPALPTCGMHQHMDMSVCHMMSHDQHTSEVSSLKNEQLRKMSSMSSANSHLFVYLCVSMHSITMVTSDKSATQPCPSHLPLLLQFGLDGLKIHGELDHLIVLGELQSHDSHMTRPSQDVRLDKHMPPTLGNPAVSQAAS